ncbi:hypothetical protein B0H14DRAFT_2624906 [Mycena olivaceomarginata]|nr:hypothetical protein B0H14DRAFT_2624906 [Mycena olivaceomarginata]
MVESVTKEFGREVGSLEESLEEDVYAQRYAKAKRAPKKYEVDECGLCERVEEDEVEYIEWTLIVDADGRIVAVLIGRPEGDDWDEVIDEINRLFDAIRRRGYKRKVFKAGSKSHRRGTYHLLFDGYSFGSGQRRPGNLRHAKEYRKLIRFLLESPAVRRVAGFQSNIFPKVYEYYRTTVQGIETDQPELKRPFDNSVYPACTWNLGPATVTAEHRDSHNLAHGVCPITSFGSLQSQARRQLYLRQLNVVIEFPSGSTAAILSGAFDHGNTPIQPGETRYSMTQYAAGALFRWARYGYQTAKNISFTGRSRKKAELDGSLGERAEWAVGLLSKADEVEEDFTRVFS